MNGFSTIFSTVRIGEENLYITCRNVPFSQVGGNEFKLRCTKLEIIYTCRLVIAKMGRLDGKVSCTTMPETF